MRTFTEKQKQQIKQSIANTRHKRTTQICKVYDCKIDESHLNKKEKEQLKMYFIEAKWFYNYILSTEKPFEFDYKTKLIKIKDRNGNFIEKELKYLPARIKQNVYKLLKQNIATLSKSKKKGNKVGKLKFKTSYNSIIFNYGINYTYYFSSKNRIKLQGIRRHLLIRGLNQFYNKFKNNELEIADMKLCRQADGYHLKITTFMFPKGEIQNKERKDVGLDFGIKNTITTSDGKKYNVFVEEPESLKKLQRKLQKKVKGSNNRYKIQSKIAKEYQKLTNKKNDIANKIVYELKSNYNNIFLQDDDFKKWQKGRFGKQVQHSVLGRIKTKLKNLKQTTIIDRFHPTTKQCYVCGSLIDINFNERTFKCDKCNLIEDRDIKGAKTILKFGQITKIPMVYREFKPVEKSVTNKISMKQEAN